MKLGKSGWSFKEMLIIIIIILVILIIACFYVYRLYSNLSYIEKNTEQKKDETKIINSTDEIEDKNYLNDYYDLENVLNDSAIEYINSNEILENTAIDYNTLKNAGYISDLQTDDDKCDGYVEVEIQDDIISTTPYIKCNNYMTEGY